MRMSPEHFMPCAVRCPGRPCKKSSLQQLPPADGCGNPGRRDDMPAATVLPQAASRHEMHPGGVAVMDTVMRASVTRSAGGYDRRDGISHSGASGEEAGQ